MAEDSGKITTEPEESQKKEEEGEKNQLMEEINAEAPSAPLPKPPAPKKRAAKKPTIVEIPVDAPAPAPPAPVLERATSSAPAAKARGRPKGAVGAAKRAQPSQPAEVAAPPPTPREEYSLEDHMTLMLRHTRQMQEARRTAVRDKYRDWVS